MILDALQLIVDTPVTRSLLADRASDLGRSSPAVAITADPAFQLLAKGRRMTPLHAENGVFLFAVPRGTTAVQLLSRVSRLTVKIGAITLLTMDNISAKAGFTFSVSGSQIQVVCYAAGTRILTATGERPVENLRQGDLVVSLTAKPPSLTWPPAPVPATVIVSANELRSEIELVISNMPPAFTVIALV